MNRIHAPLAQPAFPEAATPRGALDVDLLETCLDTALATIAARRPEVLSAAGEGELKISLAHAVLEGARLFPGDEAQIVAFALRTLPAFR
ncbi:hypothetical protein MWN34_04100 [Ancylobacter sp. 6x-1]|uniref:Uncharacterized protein n=1 Tax=Ancylobacter crimeensis TaxID=2579147 RepID=A0ABT0D808_9HYPH|nr:hypothetical protein [Ancylobacter crimeensis]MCK0196090.1 hypothetical protein [Ancylobacter crimeensis]